MGLVWLRWVTLLGGQAVPLDGFSVVLRYAPTGVVRNPDVELGVGVSAWSAPSSSLRARHRPHDPCTASGKSAAAAARNRGRLIDQMCEAFVLTRSRTVRRRPRDRSGLFSNGPEESPCRPVGTGPAGAPPGQRRTVPVRPVPRAKVRTIPGGEPAGGRPVCAPRPGRRPGRHRPARVRSGEPSCKDKYDGSDPPHRLTAPAVKKGGSLPSSPPPLARIGRAGLGRKTPITTG